MPDIDIDMDMDIDIAIIARPWSSIGSSSCARHLSKSLSTVVTAA